MRRILVGSILLSWIAFLVSVTVRGVGGAEHGLLAEMQLLLTVSPAFSLSFGFARALLTGVVVVTLTAVLWALMIAVSAAEEERRERTVSLVGAFAWVLTVTAMLTITSIFAEAPQALTMLFAIQIATLASMMAAGGVEIAAEVLRSVSSDQATEPKPVAAIRQFTPGHAGLALVATPANDREPR